MAAIEVTLSASGIFIETLSIKPIDAVIGLTELVITTQLLNAKSPKETRVKTRCIVERERLKDLTNVINQYLQATKQA